MPLQVSNNEKLRIIIDGVVYRLPLCTTSLDGDIIPLTNGNLLLDSKDLILQDSRGFYLTVEKEE